MLTIILAVIGVIWCITLPFRIYIEKDNKKQAELLTEYNASLPHFCNNCHTLSVGQLMTTYDKPYHCRACKRSEWCKVSDLGYKLIVSAYVCGTTSTFVKEGVKRAYSTSYPMV